MRSALLPESGIAASVERLVAAAGTGIACDPVREYIGCWDLEAAYRVQLQVNRLRVRDGGKIVGRKIGLTSTAVQRQLGVSQPDFGSLFADMRHESGSVISTARLIQPRVEAEIAFMIGSDLIDGPLDVAQVRDAISYATAALEICDCRIREWNITFSDTVADNAAAGLFVLGASKWLLDEVEPREVTMSMEIDGKEVSSGNGRDCLGDPLAAVAWLAHTTRDLGAPLRAGEIVLSGALGPMVSVEPGHTVTGKVTGLGTVVARFGRGDEGRAR